jgi:hypothetical protein
MSKLELAIYLGGQFLQIYVFSLLPKSDAFRLPILGA